MTAFERGIHNQSRASVAAMQALAGDSRHFAAAKPVPSAAVGTKRWEPDGNAARYVGFARRFQSGGNMRYDNGAKIPDAREEAMRWHHPMASWPIPRRKFSSERGISRPG